MRSKARPIPPAPVNSAEACHPTRHELPAPRWAVGQPLGFAEIPALDSQPQRVSEVLRGFSQADELDDFQAYAKEALQCPFFAVWRDPDLEEAADVRVCCLGVRDTVDRRGVMLKCSEDNSQRTRWILLDQLHVDGATAPYDATNAQTVAARVVSDYKYWLTELHGLDPSLMHFSGDEDDDDDFDDGGLDAPFSEQELEGGDVIDAGMDVDDDDDDDEGNMAAMFGRHLHHHHHHLHHHFGPDVVVGFDFEDGGDEEGGEFFDDDDEDMFSGMSEAGDDEQEDGDEDAAPLDHEQQWALDYASDLDDPEPPEGGQQ